MKNILHLKRSHLLLALFAMLALIAVGYGAVAHVLTEAVTVGPVVAVEPESGTISACAAKVSDTTSSNGAAVNYGTCAPAADTSNTFTLVSMPDTQHEMNSANKYPRFTQRLNWIVANAPASKLNIKYVWQVGDLVDWDNVVNDPKYGGAGTPAHLMYERASTSLKILDQNNIPYALTIGNHDTAAVCVGGAACPGADTPAELRNTTTFNSYFPTSRLKLGNTQGINATDITGVYEVNKVDNAYRTFSAGGLSFIVMNLELWPRTPVIQWAAAVAASHPHSNIIITTHSYLDGGGNIYNANGGYGANSPQYLFDNLVKAYANIKFVFSGHVANSDFRTDTGTHGNKIYEYLDCYHSETSDPMRILTFNIAAGTVKSYVYSPYTDEIGYGGVGKAYDVANVSWVK